MTLAAFRAFEMVERVHLRLAYVDSPGEVPDWDIYWSSGLTMLRAIGHVLENVDSQLSVLHREIIADNYKNSSFFNSNIYIEFIKAGRDKWLKELASETYLWKHTRSFFFERLTYEEAIEKYGEYVGINWGQEEGEDAIRLFEIAMIDWWEELCIIEQAIIEKISNPCSQGMKFRDALLSRSRYAADMPKTTRL